MYFNRDIINIIYKYTPLYYNIIINNEVYNKLETKIDIDNKIDYYLTFLYTRYHRFDEDKLYSITENEFLKGISYKINTIYVIITSDNGGKIFTPSHLIYIKGYKYRITQY